VKIPVLSFMEKDIEGTSHWFDVTRGQFIQGLAAQIGSELRLYVVTVTSKAGRRWPGVLSAL
jgi:hypothetical protein